MPLKIYTKTGDHGFTSLLGGTKVSKADLRIDAYGTIDELNSYIGLCRDLIANENERLFLQEVQDRLFTIGSTLALDPAKDLKFPLPRLHEEDVTKIEDQIDRITEALPPMEHFILPGGHSTISTIHVARCVCRRAERLCVRLAHETNEDYHLIVKYLNRLSDFLFMLARFIGEELKVPELRWQPRISEA